MKRCPECRRDYYDDRLLYCLDDGTALLEGPASTDEPATAVFGLSPSGRPSFEPRTRIFENEPREGGARNAKSIAVLPFANISADVENEYFCDGLAEELLNALAKIPELKVAARTSAFSFKGKSTDIEEIAKKLGVRTILLGSVRKAGERIRITVQLIDTSNGYHLWSERFDRVMDDIFDIQDEITSSVIGVLKVQLLGEENAKVKRWTSDPEAYELYLKGRYNWSKMEGDALQRAVTYYRQALEVDPNYALAYAGLSDAYVLLVNHKGAPFEESINTARMAANKALELDQELAEAHTSLGFLNTFYVWDWQASESSLRRAIELNPNSSFAHQVLGIRMCLERRFEEATESFRVAHELDPLSPSIAEHLGWPDYYGRNYDRAVIEFKKAVEMEPGFKNIYFRLGLAYLQLGMYDAALEQIQACQDISNDRDSVGWLGYIHGLKGDTAAARALLKELEALSKERYEPPYAFAIVHLGLGEIDEAFKWLERAAREHDYWMIFIHIDPDLDPLRGDSRFETLVKLVGIPEPDAAS